MSFTEHNHNGLIFDTADGLSALGGIRHAFTARHGGVSAAPFDTLNFADNRGDKPENLLENYRRLGSAVGFDSSRVVGCRQIHSDLVRVVTEADAGKILWNGRPYDADGMVTNTPNLPLVVFGSDCCTILLYDTLAHCVGACHAGWRGTAGGIALKTAITMMTCYGATQQTMHAAIGPSIGKCCFLVHDDVKQEFDKLLDPAIDELITPVGERYSVDLKAINRLWLLRAGLDPKNIDVHPDCTMCHPERYWSHRLMGELRGGMVGVIALEE